MEEMYRRAEAFRPRLEAISAVADQIEDNYRRYIDGCYMKVTVARSSGSSSGTASGYGRGGAAGRDWFVVWKEQETLAWRSEWEGQVVSDNASTAPCRMLWSDIANDSAAVRIALNKLEDDARAAMIYPGVMRDLRAKYRLRED